jgi:hypothetical protein
MNFTKIVRVSAIAIAMLVACSGLLAAQAPVLSVVDEPLPAIDAGAIFHAQLHARGGAPPYVWSVASGDLPDGVSLSPEGLLAGRPIKPGTFILTLKIEDSSHPANSIEREFQVAVTASLLLEWLSSPKVHDDRIDGSLLVSNGSKNIYDLTVVIVAVAENGRATAIGYEHFPLKAGATNVQIQFGNTLPSGGYVIHADAIAEVPSRNSILRQRLQSQPLQVVQGP